MILQLKDHRTCMPGWKCEKKKKNRMYLPIAHAECKCITDECAFCSSVTFSCSLSACRCTNHWNHQCCLAGKKSAHCALNSMQLNTSARVGKVKMAVSNKVTYPVLCICTSYDERTNNDGVIVSFLTEGEYLLVHRLVSCCGGFSILVFRSQNPTSFLYNLLITYYFTPGVPGGCH